MRVTTGTVVKGRIEVLGEPLAEGLAVTVLSPEGDETFTLSPNDETALLVAMAEGDRGEVISAEEFLRDFGSED
jgi:redox-sensitive bicupin YhaK (pirin superfamily)